MDLLNSFGKLAEDVGKIASAPAQVAVDLTRTVTKPVAELAEEAADMFADDEGGD